MSELNTLLETTSYLKQQRWVILRRLICGTLKN